MNPKSIGIARLGLISLLAMLPSAGFAQTNTPQRPLLLEPSATMSRSSRINPALRELIAANSSTPGDVAPSPAAAIPDPVIPAGGLFRTAAPEPVSAETNRPRPLRISERTPRAAAPAEPLAPQTIFVSGEVQPTETALLLTNAAPASVDLRFRETLADLEDARMEAIARRIDEGGFGPVRGGRVIHPIDRGLETIFAPEPIRIGHAYIGFSPYTAIKRRNPLCLLNPIPFILSW